MKNRAVEWMVREQFSIPPDVDVTFLMYDENGFYHFEVVWYNIDIRYQSNFQLPHIEYTTQDMLA